MARELFTVPYMDNNWLNRPAPLDAKTIFKDFDQLNEQLPGNIRFKGQKFIIQNPPGEYGEGPKEFWFVDDYIEGGPEKNIWTFDDANKGLDEENEEFDWELYEETFDLHHGEYWVEKQDPEPIIPQPELYQPGGEVNLDEHNSDQTAHQPIRQLISDLDGETLVASKRDDFEYKNLDETKMTINQYADRAPNAWSNNKTAFDQIPELFGNTTNSRKFDGTFFVR